MRAVISTKYRPHVAVPRVGESFDLTPPRSSLIAASPLPAAPRVRESRLWPVRKLALWKDGAIGLVRQLSARYGARRRSQSIARGDDWEVFVDQEEILGADGVDASGE